MRSTYKITQILPITRDPRKGLKRGGWGGGGGGAERGGIKKKYKKSLTT